LRPGRRLAPTATMHRRTSRRIADVMCCAIALAMIATAREAAASTVGIEWEIERGGGGAPGLRVSLETPRAIPGSDDVTEDPMVVDDAHKELLCTIDREHGRPLIAITYDQDQVIEIVTAPIEMATVDARGDRAP